MAIGDVSAEAFHFTLTNAVPAPLLTTVPADEEWTIRLMRGVCKIATGGTAPTMSVGTSNAADEFCFNEFVAIPSASASGVTQVFGPDFYVAKPGTQIYGRASANSAVRLTINAIREKVA